MKDIDTTKFVAKIEIKITAKDCDEAVKQINKNIRLNYRLINCCYEDITPGYDNACLWKGAECCTKRQNHQYMPLTRTPNLYSKHCKICNSDLGTVDKNEHPKLFETD